MVGEKTLEEKIVEYLSAHKVCRLALSRNNQPSLYTMYYVNKGLVLYVECDPTSEKVSTIMHNNSVAVNVDENYEDWKKIKGVQLFGVIEEVKESKWDSINSMFLEKFPQLEEYGGTPRHHKFYEISPSKVYFLDFEGYFGKRELLRIEPKKSILRWS